MADCRNLASLSLFYRHFFGRCLSELAELVPLLKGSVFAILIDCLIFLLPFVDVNKDSYANSSFPRTARLLKSLPIECFPLAYMNGFKSRIKRHLLPVDSFKADFLYTLVFYWSFSCNSIPCTGCSALHRVNCNWKKKKNSDT